MLACVVGVKKGWRAGVGEEEENSGKKNGGVLHCCCFFFCWNIL